MDVITTLIWVLLQMSTSVGPDAIPIAESTAKYAAKYQVDPFDILAVIYHESRFKPRARSRTHDHGLMQIHCPSRSYASWCRNLKKLLQIDYNIKIGVMILAKRRDRCKRKKHRHKSHWIRHYNWNDKKYDLKILKIRDHMKWVADGLKEPPDVSR